jgi:selenocysteine-specific elongation factor
MKHVIIGTAGHVDHGKTTLIKALTGTDPDRLKEEQERGMTIDLGFARLILPDGTRAGIVDVPGHEKFIKNMLAGAGGVDVALLVIAADESVMPQTSEHVDILRLLDVKQGVIALTKIDTVEEEWISAVEEDIRKRLKGTFLEAAPIVRVDSLRGVGTAELRKALMSAASRITPRDPTVPFRLPIDRVFTRPGHGTVVTGTLLAGTLRTGDTVEILPQQKVSRIRGLQMHGEKCSEAHPGSRVAVNLAGVDVEEVTRGSVLAPTGVFPPTQIIDAELSMLPGAARPLANRARVRLHIGTDEVIGRVQVLGAEQILPGESGFVQFRAENIFAAARGDLCIVRTYSPMQTIAGGLVLDTHPGRHRRMDPAVTEALRARRRGGAADLVSTVLGTKPYGCACAEIVQQLAVSEKEVETALLQLQQDGTVQPLGRDRYILTTHIAAVLARAHQLVESFHRNHPLKPGIPREELRVSLGRGVDQKAFNALLAAWTAAGALRVEGPHVALPNFEITLSPKQQALLHRVAAVYEAAGLHAPLADDVCRAVGAPPDAVLAMLRIGAARGEFIPLDEGLWYHHTAATRARGILEDLGKDGREISVGEFRDATGTSRKYAVPLLEYFDSVGITRRRGDNRVLTERENRDG